MDNNSPSIWCLLDILLEAFSKGEVWDEHANSITIDHNISKGEAELLYQVVRENTPEFVLETGMAYGISSIAILQACEHNNIGVSHIIDPFQSYYRDIGLSMVRKAGLECRLCYHRAYLWEVMPKLGRIDFAFIDSSHLFDHTLLEFVLIDQKLKLGGWIGFHDFLLPAIQSVVSFIVENRGYEMITVNDLPNIVFLEKKSDDQRHWRFFRPFTIKGGDQD